MGHPGPWQGPISLMIFHHNSNLSKFQSSDHYTILHMACAKWCCDVITRNGVMVKKIFMEFDLWWQKLIVKWLHGRFMIVLKWEIGCSIIGDINDHLWSYRENNSVQPMKKYVQHNEIQTSTLYNEIYVAIWTNLLTICLDACTSMMIW